jgi:uncharacterized protein YvpB
LSRTGGHGLALFLSIALLMAAAFAMPPHGWITAHADTIGDDPAAVAATSWFNWIDHASPGMSNDNIHLVNPGNADASGTITVPGLWSGTFRVPAGGTTYVPVPYGIIGGPAVVQVASGPGVLASQRVQYQQSIGEIAAATVAANALLHGWFPWYDRASPGTLNDNIHVVNPGGQAASGVFMLPGSAALPFNVPAGQERYYAFPFGTINGPLHFDVTSGPAVIVSQRVQYSGSFSEVLALDGRAAQNTLYFNWFDSASPGVVANNIHIVNPAASGSVNVKVGGPGFSVKTYTLSAGQGAIVNWAGLGGPIRIDADGAGVLATQRLQWPPNFAEWPGLPPSAARNDTWFSWYDDASPGFVDDIHVANPGSAAAAVSITLAGGSQVSLNVPAGADVHYTYPTGTIGGPLRVQVTSGPGVFATQRAFLRPLPTSRTLNVPQYFQHYALSCEEAALRMALAYEGINVSEDQIYGVMGIDYRPPVRDASGFHWGDPYAQFVGDPNGSEVNDTGYGSYNEAVARTAVAMGGSVIASGEQVIPSTVYQSVLSGHPVIAWISFDWTPHATSMYTAFDGRWVRFGAPYEHAVTIIGVTPDSILVNNPWQGQQWISKSQFESAYGMFNQMAVVIR